MPASPSAAGAPQAPSKLEGLRLRGLRVKGLGFGGLKVQGIYVGLRVQGFRGFGGFQVWGVQGLGGLKFRRRTEEGNEGRRFRVWVEGMI